MAGSHSTPTWCFQQRLGQRTWQWKLILVLWWIPYPWAGIRKIFLHKINESRYPKQGTLIPTNHSWISHDGKPQPFLGPFQPCNPSLGCTWYNSVFKDATNPQILLSYARSEYIGILEIKVPNLTVPISQRCPYYPQPPQPRWHEEDCQTCHLKDPLTTLSWCTSPWCGTLPSGLRKTTRTVWFRDPISHYMNNTMPQDPPIPAAKNLFQPLSPLNPVHPSQSPSHHSNPSNPSQLRHFHPLQQPNTSLPWS